MLLHAIIPVVCRSGRPNLLIQKVLCLNDVVDVRRGVKKTCQTPMLDFTNVSDEKEKRKKNKQRTVFSMVLRIMIR